MDATRVILIVNTVVTIITHILAWMYLIPLVLIKRFHTSTNILIGNFVVSAMICGLFWIIFDVLSAFYPSVLMQNMASCIIIRYLRVMVNCLLIYSLVMIAINRFFTIKYPNKRLFKRKTWPFMSAVIHWIIVMILPIPEIFLSLEDCNINTSPYWVGLYEVCVILILPSILHIIFNSLIFISVRSSTRRVHALTTTSSAVNSSQQHKRDVYLLKHIVFMFIVFIVGWGPVYIISLVNSFRYTSLWVILLLEMLPVLSSLINAVDLFLYNHELRQYLKERCFKRLC